MKLYANVYIDKGEAGTNRLPNEITIDLRELIRQEILKSRKDEKKTKKK